MTGKAGQDFCVYVISSNEIKAGRDRFSGILRFASEIGNWQIRQISPEAIPDALRNGFSSGRNADGIIGHEQCILQAIRYMEDSGDQVPTVLMDGLSRSAHSTFPLFAEVCLDDAALSNAAADLLLRRGLKNFAYVGDSGGELDRSRVRESCFRKRVEDAGFTCSSFQPCEESSGLWFEGLQRMADWLSELPKPCGIMAYCDRRAKEIYDACHIAHLQIPDQLRIVGVDNDAVICENLSPTLTSIEPDFEGCGYLAAKLLNDFLTGKRSKRTASVFYYGLRTIAERASTQDVKGGARIVTAARELIRLNAESRINVRGIADRLHVSYRLLELRFHDVLGISVAEEIRRVRLENVCRMLRKTERSIGEICECSGFDSASHLSALFKKSYGMTMRQYRYGGCLQPPTGGRRQ